MKKIDSEMVNPLWLEMIKVVKREVVPALGCTEPVSLALAAAIAAQRLGKPVEKIEAKVSANLMKNGMGVTVPGTGMTGLFIAAAVGAIGGDPWGKLEVLKNLTPAQVRKAQQMVAQGRVEVMVADVPHVLYSEAKVMHGEEWVTVAIADTHTQVVRIEENGKVVFQMELEDYVANAMEYKSSIAGIKARDVFDFAIGVPLEMIRFIHEAAELNTSLSREGMSGQYGLHIGTAMDRQRQQGLLTDGLLTQILMRTTAASDARMGGAALPAMTNSGSGNQGIAATMPVVVVAEYVKANEESLIRALMLSHMMGHLHP